MNTLNYLVLRPVAFFVITASVYSCSETYDYGAEPNRRNENNNLSNSNDSSTNANPELEPQQTAQQPSQSQSAPGSSEQTGTTTGGTNATANDSSIETFCSRAGETFSAQGQVSAAFGYLCNGNSPTALLSSNLIAKAYKGQGTPAIEVIQPDQHSGDMTSVILGVAIELPIDLETFSNKVSPSFAERDFNQRVAQATNSKLAAFEVRQSFAPQPPYHVSGSQFRIKTTQNFLLLVNIENDRVLRADRFELAKNEAYLFTQNLVQGIQTMRGLQMATAGIKVNGKSYLITVSSIAVDNKGARKQASDSIRSNVEIMARETFRESQKHQ